jgi:hypothetical protein
MMQGKDNYFACSRHAPHGWLSDCMIDEQHAALSAVVGTHHGNIVQGVRTVEHHTLAGEGLGQILGGLRLACSEKASIGIRTQSIRSRHHAENKTWQPQSCSNQLALHSSCLNGHCRLRDPSLDWQPNVVCAHLCLLAPQVHHPVSSG